MRIRRKLQRAWEREGLLGTLRLIAVNLVTLPRQWFAPPRPRDPFDETYGVETTDRVKLSELDLDSPNYAYGVEYSPVMPSRLEAALQCLEIDHTRFTFIDLGSGKGRALLLAAAWPFRRIVGVEFARELHSAAEANLARYTGPRRCTQIETVCEDATRFEFPVEPTVVFLYNPFVGRTMLAVLENLARSVAAQPREVYLVYVYPKMAAEVAKRPAFEPLVVNDLHGVYRVRAS